MIKMRERFFLKINSFWQNLEDQRLHHNSFKGLFFDIEIRLAEKLSEQI